ncbi:hypothetical protein GUJ93_ZPchr0002g23857 [Zizania palustris]|uniref:Chloride channel protein n=1 Tax=Zizania palustris TaxID=103762 RepID=A0A8J5VTI0_ZIZPA|nr:hypothetical protein GUJ93_ZPchr0002g23857 [Zizania palustris]
MPNCQCTPNEGAAWLRLQRLVDTWQRILLIPVTGGVVVGMIHGLLEIFDQLKFVKPPQKQGINFLAANFPTVNAVQAAVTLGTGCSLGPEGPSVDFGKSCANWCSEMMGNNRERRIALGAAGAASGIASGGLYAPSLMIGAAVGAVFGGSVAYLINSAIPCNAAVAQPQAYALVVMAATLASVCSVPLTSVLLLFELAKDYRIYLPLMRAVGLSIWVPSVLNQPNDGESSGFTPRRDYSSVSSENRNSSNWREGDSANDLELTSLHTDINSYGTYGYNEEMLLDDLKVGPEVLTVAPRLAAPSLAEVREDGRVLAAANRLDGVPLTLG